MWQCLRCGQDSYDSVRPALCPRCGNVETYIQPEPYRPPQCAADFGDTNLPRIPTGEFDVDELLGGGFVEQGRIFMWGRGGTGKSRLAMRWGTGFGNCLYLSLEMFDAIAVQTAQTCGARLERLFFQPTYGNFQRAAREKQARVIVVDSISVVPFAEQPALLRDLKIWAEKTDGIVFVLGHQNKRGLFVGKAGLQHWCDYELFLKSAKTGGTIVELLKSRGCPLWRCRCTLGKPDAGDIADEREETSDDEAEPESEPELAH